MYSIRLTLSTHLSHDLGFYEACRQKTTCKQGSTPEKDLAIELMYSPSMNSEGNHTHEGI